MSTSINELPPINTRVTTVAIPEALQALDNWVLWKPKWNGKKYEKIPKDASGRAGSSTNSATWSPLQTVIEAQPKHENHGVGFVIVWSLGLTGIDLDHCFNPDTGKLMTYAQAAVRQLNSYTEKSPSGNGVRIFIRGRIPDEYLAANKGGEMQQGRRSENIEVYSGGRFLTVTGDHIEGTPLNVEERQKALDDFCRQYFKPASKGTTDVDVDLQESTRPTDEITERFMWNGLGRLLWLHTASWLQGKSASQWDMAIANYCVDMGWPDSEIIAAMRAWRTKHDEDPGKIDRRDYVERTLKEARQRTSQKRTDEDIGKNEPPPAGPASAPVFSEQKTPPPSELYDLDGAVKLAYDYFLATARYPQPIFALGAALTATGAVMGNHFHLENLYPNLYTVCIGPTGCGKESLRAGIKQIMMAAGLIEHVGESIGSGPGVEDRLMHLVSTCRAPAVTYLIDEFGKMMQGLKANDGKDHQIMEILLKLYTAAGSLYVPRDLSTRSMVKNDLPRYIENPFVGIFGSSTQESTHAALSSTDAEVGWLGRFLLLPTHLNRPKRQQPADVSRMPDALVQWIENLHAAVEQVTGNLGEYTGAGRIAVPLDKSAIGLESQISDRIDDELASDVLHPITRAATVRAMEMVKKLAMIRTVGRDPFAPMITTRDLDWGLALVTWAREHITHELIESIESAGGGESARQSDRCLEFIKRARCYNDQEFLPATREGFMPRRLLQKKMKIKATEFNGLVEDLITVGAICEVSLTKEQHGINCDSALHVACEAAA